MENNLILEGLLSNGYRTERRRQEQADKRQLVGKETMKRFDAIEQCLLELRNNPTIPGNELQAISTLLAAIRKGGTGTTEIP